MPASKKGVSHRRAFLKVPDVTSECVDAAVEVPHGSAPSKPTGHDTLPSLTRNTDEAHWYYSKFSYVNKLRRS
jgi:hypothetical protein